MKSHDNGQGRLFDVDFRLGPRFTLPLSLEEMRRSNSFCTMCHHHVELYGRNLGLPLVRFLWWLNNTCQNNEYANRLDAPIMQGVRGGGDYGKLQLWRMIEPAPVDPGENSAGLWRPTDIGRRFLSGEISVPKYAHEYRSRLWDYEPPWIYVWDAIKWTEFRYRSLLDGKGSYF